MLFMLLIVRLLFLTCVAVFFQALHLIFSDALMVAFHLLFSFRSVDVTDSISSHKN